MQEDRKKRGLWLRFRQEKIIEKYKSSHIFFQSERNTAAKKYIKVWMQVEDLAVWRGTAGWVNGIAVKCDGRLVHREWSSESVVKFARMQWRCGWTGVWGIEGVAGWARLEWRCGRGGVQVWLDEVWCVWVAGWGRLEWQCGSKI